MRAVEEIDIVPEDLLHMNCIKRRKGCCFDFSTKYLSVNTSVEPIAHRGTFNIAAYSSKKKWATHVFDVSGNFHYGDHFQFSLLDEDFYDPQSSILIFPRRSGCPYAVIAKFVLNNVQVVCTPRVLDFLQRIQVRGPLHFFMSEVDKASFWCAFKLVEAGLPLRRLSRLVLSGISLDGSRLL